MSFVTGFLVIVLLFLGVYHSNKMYNKTMHTLEFDDSLVDGKEDGKIRVRIAMRGYDQGENASWYYTMEGNSADHYVGAIYEMTLTNLTEYEIEDWSATVYFPMDTLLAEGWNGDFEVHQYVDEKENSYTFENSKFVTDGLTLDYIPRQNVLLMPMHKGDFFNYLPSKSAMEVPIEESEDDEPSQKTVGFITYTKNMLEAIAEPIQLVPHL